MFTSKYFESSNFYKDLIKNLALIKSLFNIKKSNLEETFKKLKIGGKAIQDLGFKHPYLENDTYLKLIREGMEQDQEFKDFFISYFKNLTYDNLIKFEIRNYYILLFIEFEIYLTNCIRSFLIEFPKILDKRSISREELFEIKDLNQEAIDEILIDKLIHDISYGNLLDLFNKTEKILKVKHNFEENLIKELSGYREIRHLHIHKGGKIDLIFIQKIRKLGFDSKKMGINDLVIGSRVEITMKMLEKAENLCLEVAYLFDKSFKRIYKR